ncbi:MAG: enoyl-CoA hydratase-related protein [Desulfobacterales bacterium]|nr:enoyl-CoA hydratase-related protein [Desulfobacterales bacterium]
MEYENILVQVRDSHVAVLTLNRPDQMNTFTTPMAGELNTALLSLDKDPQVRVILIKGAGRAFCAGIDVNELEGQTPLEYQNWIEHMEAPLVTIGTMETPVIAQVQGVAAANGMGLAASADLVMAADNVKMGLTAINVGLNCVGPVIPVARCVGRKRALELLLYGRLIKVEEAREMGLVNRIVPRDELEDAALAWAEELAKKSPLAVTLAKTAFYQSEDLPYGAQFAHMNQVFARLCTTEDAREGVQAFFEKRNPQWQGK